MAMKPRCRHCDTPLLTTFVDLGETPLCESFLTVDQLSEPEPYYPLHAMVCGECFLVQVDEFVSPAAIFDDYAYYSSYSTAWLEHARQYVDMAIERFDLTGFDLVISTSHAVAKGCRPPEDGVNVCYCFTPMRYIWFLYREYFGDHLLKKLALGPYFAYLRRWDVRSSRRVDRFLAISKNVAERINRIYSRKAEVIYPPVDTEFFCPGMVSGDFFLIVSALVPYKRLDLAISAFNRLGLPLKVVGTGPLAGKLKESAGPQIKFLGWQSDQSLRDLYRSCRALIFPGVEDFGIVPLEAQSCGRPVIGLGEGGLMETTVPWPGGNGEAPTGIFFPEQTEESLSDVINLFLENEAVFDREAIRAHALKFGRDRFKEEFRRKIEEILINRKL